MCDESLLHFQRMSEDQRNSDPANEQREYNPAMAFEIEMEENHQASVREAQEIILREDEEAIELPMNFDTNFSTQHALT